MPEPVCAKCFGKLKYYKKDKKLACKDCGWVLTQQTEKNKAQE